MRYKIGTRLFSATSSTEVIVTRAANLDAELCCHGAPMLLADQARTLNQSSGDDVPLGKRYIHADAGFEVLCVKGGAGPLTLNGVPLEMRQAKPLPSSD